MNKKTDNTVDIKGLEEFVGSAEVQKYIKAKVEEGIKEAKSSLSRVTTVAALQMQEDEIIRQMQDNAALFEKLAPYIEMKMVKNEFGKLVYVVDKAQLSEEALKADLQNEKLRKQLEKLYAKQLYVRLKHIPEGMHQNEEGMTFSYNGRYGALLLEDADVHGVGKDKTQIITYGEYKECLLRSANVVWNARLKKNDKGVGYVNEPRLIAPIIDVVGVVED